MQFSKYHALGNDYIVVDGAEWKEHLSPAIVRRVCNRHFGVGSDGILVKGAPYGSGFELRILNPDGSEAEKSGNGLRIFARYLWDKGLVTNEPFDVSTPGGTVRCHVFDRGRAVTVDMGRVSFQSDLIPVSGARREVIGEELQAGGKRFVVNAATIGNPHCVIVVPELDKEEVLRYGPLLEHHPQFPRRTNVQFLKVIDRSTIQIEIWERGAGYTLASGSSSSASAAVARRLGLVGEDVTVRMPGGELSIHIASDYAIRMTGPVTGVSTGTLVEECLIGAE